jgi:hypothetical protein
MINNIRKLNVFNYVQEEQLVAHNSLYTSDKHFRHKHITGASVMQLMFRYYPEDTAMLLDMGVSLSVETYEVDSTFRKRWEILAHVTTDQKRQWDEYKFMEKLAGKNRELI